MRSLSIEQIFLFFLVIGLPLLKSIAGIIRKRNLSSPEEEAAPRDNEQQTSWLRAEDDDLPWSRSSHEKSTPPAPPVTLRPAPHEVAKVAPPTLRKSVWQMAAAPLEKPASPVARRKERPLLPSAGASASAVVRQIPRDQVGQRRAIVFMAVFGPPRALDPPP
jgi:hypothetical protein